MSGQVKIPTVDILMVIIKYAKLFGMQRVNQLGSTPYDSSFTLCFPMQVHTIKMGLFIIYYTCNHRKGSILGQNFLLVDLQTLLL